MLTGSTARKHLDENIATTSVVLSVAAMTRLYQKKMTSIVFES